MGVSAVFSAIANTLTGGVVDKALSMVDKLIPDKNQAARLKFELETLRVTQEHELEMAENALANAQIEVNKEEAKNENIFVAGWRPAIGWICALGIGYTYIFQPMIAWGYYMYVGHPLVGTPVLNTGELMALVLAMLGIAGLRTIDKYNGTAPDSVK